MKDVYVVSCCRTAIGSFGGSLKDTPATDLGAVVVKASSPPPRARTPPVRSVSRPACPSPCPPIPWVWSAVPA